MLFKICKAGDNQPIYGLENIPADHAQMLMLVPVAGYKLPKELRSGESTLCRPGTHAEPTKRAMVDTFTVVRTE
jgi:hypothetical protein